MKIFIIIFFCVCYAQENIYVDSSKVKNPEISWKLSFIPGLGQIYNKKYLKAIGFASAEAYAVSKFILLKNENRVGLRNTYAWWIFGLYVWNILDAYVDSHLSTFPIKKLQSNEASDSLKTGTE